MFDCDALESSAQSALRQARSARSRRASLASVGSWRRGIADGERLQSIRTRRLRAQSTHQAARQSRQTRAVDWPRDNPDGLLFVRDSSELLYSRHSTEMGVVHFSSW